MKRRTLTHGVWHLRMTTTLCGKRCGWDSTLRIVPEAMFAEVTCPRCATAISRGTTTTEHPSSPASSSDGGRVAAGDEPG